MFIIITNYYKYDMNYRYIMLTSRHFAFTDSKSVSRVFVSTNSFSSNTVLNIVI